jgi:hypothetical protein
VVQEQELVEQSILEVVEEEKEQEHQELVEQGVQG